MKKALLIVTVLFIAVISTACINNIAVQELNNKAAEYMQKGDYESAMNRLQASLDLDSTMYETYYNLGIAATKARKYDIAIEAFESGIKIKSEFPNFYYSLAVAQFEYADYILDGSNKAEQSEDDSENESSEITEEDKAKAAELKTASLENLTKYIEMNPDAEDKETVENLIKECQDFLNPSPESETKVLEG